MMEKYGMDYVSTSDYLKVVIKNKTIHGIGFKTE